MSGDNANHVPDPIFTLKTEFHTSCIQFVPDIDKKLLICGNELGKLKVWDLKTYKPNQTSKLNSLHMPYDIKSINTINNLLIVQDKNSTVRIFKCFGNSWVVVKNIDLDYYGFCRVMVDSCQGGIALLPYNGSVGVISLKNDFDTLVILKKKSNLKGFKPSAFKVITLFKKHYILVSYENSHMCLWDPAAKEIIQEVSHANYYEMSLSIDFDDSQSKGVTGGFGNKILVFAITKNLSIVNEKCIEMKNFGLNVVKLRPDMKLFAAACFDEKLRLYSWKSVRLLAALEHSASVEDVCFLEDEEKSNSGSYLMASCGMNGEIKLWDLYSS